MVVMFLVFYVFSFLRNLDTTTPSLHSPNFEVGCSPPASAAASHRRNLILQESSGEGLGGK